MKVAIYSLIALTLILSACGVREPKETSGIEPKAVVSVAPNRELSTINLVYPNHSYDFKEEARKSQNFYEFIASSVEAKEKKSKKRAVVMKPAAKKVATATPSPLPKTKILQTQAKTGESVKNGKKRIFTLTAYTAGYESTGKRKGDKDYGRTSSGAMVKQGRTAACPKSYPTGTKVYIPSLNKTYTCEDTGGAIKEGKLDIYFDDVDVARDFGRKKNTVGYVIKKGSGS